MIERIGSGTVVSDVPVEGAFAARLAAIERHLETLARSVAVLAREAPQAQLPSYSPARISRIDSPRTPGQRLALAQLALEKSMSGAHRESVIDLAELAWGDGALRDADGHGDAWPLLARALLLVDELERADVITEAAPMPQSRESRAAAHCCRAWIAYHQGRIDDALAAAHAASDERPAVARAVIAACRIAQGQLEDAERAIGDPVGADAVDPAVLLDVRAQLHLAQMRPAEALEDAREAGRRSTSGRGAAVPGAVAWRSTAAFALVALGERERARTLAQEELELARERGVARVVVRNLRVLAVAADGRRRIDLLGEAVAAAGAEPRLEHVRALVDLGAATRRANQRSAAREPLREALDRAQSGGASALAELARDELAATGARPRRVMLTGLDALTPSERRVADLAAGGFTTRQIAQTLFVTPKTVEFHLRHVYRKLDIPSSREELARAVVTAPLDNLALVRKESSTSSNAFRSRSPGGAGELRDHRRRSR